MTELFTPIDATAHRSYSDEYRSQFKNHVSRFLRKKPSFSPYYPIAKNRPFLSFPIISRPIVTYLGARIWSVSVQKGQQGS
jgi:hypothetical protein